MEQNQSTIDPVFLLSRDQRNNRQGHWKGNICKKNFFAYLSFCKLYPKGGMYLTIITVLILNVFGSRPSDSPKIYQGVEFCTKISRLQEKYGQSLITSSGILSATNSEVIRQHKKNLEKNPLHFLLKLWNLALPHLWREIDFWRDEPSRTKYFVELILHYWLLQNIKCLT